MSRKQATTRSSSSTSRSSVVEDSAGFGGPLVLAGSSLAFFAIGFIAAWFSIKPKKLPLPPPSKTEAEEKLKEKPEKEHGEGEQEDEQELLANYDPLDMSQLTHSALIEELQQISSTLKQAEAESKRRDLADEEKKFLGELKKRMSLITGTLQKLENDVHTSKITQEQYKEMALASCELHRKVAIAYLKQSDIEQALTATLRLKWCADDLKSLYAGDMGAGDVNDGEDVEVPVSVNQGQRVEVEGSPGR